MNTTFHLTREIHEAYSETRRTLQRWSSREGPEQGPLWDLYDKALDRFYEAVADFRTHAEEQGRKARRYESYYHQLRREIAEAVYTDRISPAELAAAWGITEEEAN